jgi:hypothetical protein
MASSTLSSALHARSAAQRSFHTAGCGASCRWTVVLNASWSYTPSAGSGAARSNSLDSSQHAAMPASAAVAMAQSQTQSQWHWRPLPESMSILSTHTARANACLCAYMHAVCPLRLFVSPPGGQRSHQRPWATAAAASIVRVPVRFNAGVHHRQAMGLGARADNCPSCGWSG